MTQPTPVDQDRNATAAELLKRAADDYAGNKPAQSGDSAES